ncbi:hypothetical protein BJX99DRAFT_254485 [Aspergillus californicus]
MSSKPLIKQIAAGRRKPNLTRKEYFDHRFQIHGGISDAPDDNDLKPHKYIQTQAFDSAFGQRQGGPMNANQHWSGRDDTTELFFRDWEHVLSCFSSDYVKDTIAPDGVFFADLETSIVLMAWEKPVEVPTRLAAERANVPLDKGDAVVAMYFLSTPDDAREGQQLEATLTPLLIEALMEYSQDEVWGLIANIGVVSEKFDLNAYFGGANMPQYSLVYKVFLKGAASTAFFRRSQKMFESAAGENIDLGNSFVVFSQEALVMDVGKDIRFSRDRQPLFEDLPGPSHLDW